MLRTMPLLQSGLLAALLIFGFPCISQSEVIRGEPDDFPAGTNLGTAFPGVRLSVEGRPDVTVQSLEGTLVAGPTAGRNIASTGTLVFGHNLTGGSLPEQDFFRLWGDSGVATILRAEFTSPTDFVAIDAIANDDDSFVLRAFDESNTEVATFLTGSFRDDVRTMTISRPTADIVYVLASGFGPEGVGLLDNLRFNGPALIIIGIDIKPGSEPNCLNINGHGVIPVAILGADDFDVREIDLTSLTFAGLQIRLRGKKWPQCAVEFSDGDDYLDLVCHFQDDPDFWAPGDGVAELRGVLLDGTPIEGSDSICVVP